MRGSHRLGRRASFPVGFDELPVGMCILHTACLMLSANADGLSIDEPFLYSLAPQLFEVINQLYSPIYCEFMTSFIFLE